MPAGPNVAHTGRTAQGVPSVVPFAEPVSWKTCKQLGQLLPVPAAARSTRQMLLTGCCKCLTEFLCTAQFAPLPPYIGKEKPTYHPGPPVRRKLPASMCRASASGACGWLHRPAPHRAGPRHAQAGAAFAGIVGSSAGCAAWHAVYAQRYDEVCCICSFACNLPACIAKCGNNIEVSITVTLPAIRPASEHRPFISVATRKGCLCFCDCRWRWLLQQAGTCSATTTICA